MKRPTPPAALSPALATDAAADPSPAGLLERGRRLLLAALLCLGSGSAVAEEYHYTILGPDGEAVVRYVTERRSSSCPVVEGEPFGEKPMEPRFPGSSTFPITVCEARLAPGATRASIRPGRGEPLSFPLLSRKPTRIAVIGDTGCKVNEEKVDKKSVYTGQNCNDPESGWPLAKIAGTIAAEKPDLVIHVGDYIYRKVACPPDKRKECGDSPYGVSWETLETEIFAPARELLRAAPWVVPRGNHENCNIEKPKASQGGIGFFLLLDPRPLARVVELDHLIPYLEFLGGVDMPEKPPSACRPGSDPYIVPVDDDLELWVIDSNEPDATREFAGRETGVVERYRKELEALGESSKRSTRWLITHRPLYGLWPKTRKKILPILNDEEALRRLELYELNVTLQEAYEQYLRSNPQKPIQLAIAGHIHVFQAIWGLQGDGGAERPASLVVGGSGTKLDDHFAKIPGLQSSFRDRKYRVGLAGPEAQARGVTISKSFSFMLVEKSDPGGWSTARVMDPDGNLLARCTLGAGEAFGCTLSTGH